MVGARHQRMTHLDERLFHQLRLRWEGQRDAGKIDLAGEQRRNDAVDRAFGQADFHFRKLLMKGGDNAGQDHRDPHRSGADAERAGDALLERADLPRRASTSPCLVSATPVGKRSNSGTPMVFSSWRMLRVSAG